ncbi:MAG: AAA family ATPase [Holosporaceae bacterium]|nr:AAA family ATPase [Holosporaceae bacterium]
MIADILKLSCRNFRSYHSLFSNFSSKFVVFYGENGAGKTNILEAISLFSSGRGLRKAPIADLNCLTSPPLSWNLELVLNNNQYKTFLSTNVQNGRRIAKIDNSQINSLLKFDEFLWMLWIIPNMTNIFISHQTDRRNFFDHLVSGYDKKHKLRIKKLNILQKERLHVIFFRKDENWLKVLEEKIALESMQVTKSRLEFIMLLHKTFDEYPSDFLRPKIKITGSLEEIHATNSEENAILEITDSLKNCRFEDSEKQTTSIGIHKTLWLANHPKTGLEAENCSTGEQKAFLVSLILAVVRIYKNSRAGIPILLLDDLFVYLDEKRRQILTNELIAIGVQTFLTGTERNLFSGFSQIAQTFLIEKSICTEKT